MAQNAVLILGRYIFPFHEWIGAEYKRILFTSSEFKKSIPHYQARHFAHIEYFDNYETNMCVELKAAELHKKYGFSRIVYQAEQDVLRAAQIRELLGLAGQSVETAIRFRDKVIMKESLLARPDVITNVLIPAFTRVTGVKSILEFVAKYDYPIVIKPIRGMGSMNTGIINSMEELQSFLRLGLSGNVDGPIDYEIEKFIRGEMYHIDGLFYNGQVKLCWPSKYINTCVDFKSNAFLGSYALHKDNPMTEALQSLVEPILMALDRSSSYSFHIEVWDMQPNVPFTKDEEIPRLERFAFCEAACRTGGAGVAAATVQLLGVDLNKACVQSQLFDSPLTSPIPPDNLDWRNQIRHKNNEDVSVHCREGCTGWVVVYGNPNDYVLPNPDSECPVKGVCSWGLMEQGEDRAHCTAGFAQFIFASTSEEQVQKDISAAISWLTKNRK
jgi:hypothetical protein